MKTETPPPTKTIPALLHNLRDDSASLLRQQVALAKAEINESAMDLANRVVAIAIGGAFVFAGLLLIVIAGGDLVAFGLVEAGVHPDIALWLGPLLLGVVVAIAGWGTFAKAKQALSAHKLAPTETVESMKDNKDWAKEKIQSS